MKKILAIMLVTTALMVSAHASPPVGPLADNERDQWRRCGEPDHPNEWTKARIKSVIINCSEILKSKNKRSFLKENDYSQAAYDSLDIVKRTLAAAQKKLRSLGKK
jgi:hypothetical protein